jgi:hypothetical protein
MWAGLQSATDEVAHWARQIAGIYWLILAGVALVLVSMLIVSRMSQR